MLKVLNVAEKNNVAKGIAQLLSRGAFRTRNGKSVYNKIYEFPLMFMGKQSTMIVTSVSGHLLHLDFHSNFKNWQTCSPIELFSAPVHKSCSKDYLPIKETLEREIRGCQVLVIWTDCDREGENIGYEVIDVCTKFKPRLDIYRAVFSEVTQRSIQAAVQNLKRPNKRLSDAVDVRIELDLRIGASFTRFQTLRFQKLFPAVLAQNLISYGSCQFPTLGFVVERYKQIKDFIREPFWKLRVSYKTKEGEDLFAWERGRLFGQSDCLIYHQICLKNPTATVTDVRSKKKSKWRPLPLETVELQKLASRKLRMNAQLTMNVAEKLYTQGFISYPRTETNTFPSSLDLRPLVQMQTENRQWGEFATRVLNDGPNPRRGSKSDEAHPPIHPTKYADNLTGDEKRLYEFIVRHFLACLAKDAEGFETTVTIDIAQEKFTASGLMITERNYLDVYPYDKWSDKNIQVYTLGQKFQPSEISMLEGSTEPPPLLTEADLIALMEKHGIG
ncbi:DNA topoisomerase 3-alpha [Chamberlinius hualienensis]